MDHVPGAILVSIVAPTIFAGGPAEALAVVVVLVALRTGSLRLAMATGVGSVLVLRVFLTGLV